MHKVFISYHHNNDQSYKNALAKWNQIAHAFIDKSVDTGEIDDSLSDESIREKIRDKYLQDSTVTVLLVGTETKNRKHIDWELYSSMYDGAVNKKSGIVAILLPSITGGRRHRFAPHGADEKALYPDIDNWVSVESRSQLMWGGFQYLPDRVIDNIMPPHSNVSVTTWDDIANDTSILIKLIDLANKNRAGCNYDLSRPMKRRNS